jgi:hypothetical protein
MIRAIRNQWTLLMYTYWLLMSGYFTLQEVAELSYYARGGMKR